MHRETGGGVELGDGKTGGAFKGIIVPAEPRTGLNMIDSFYRADLPLRTELSRISSLPLFAKLITRQDAANSTSLQSSIQTDALNSGILLCEFHHDLFLQFPRFEGYIFVVQNNDDNFKIKSVLGLFGFSNFSNDARQG